MSNMELILDIFVLLIALLALIVGTVVVMRMEPSAQEGSAEPPAPSPEASSTPRVDPPPHDDLNIDLDPRLTPRMANLIGKEAVQP